MNLVERCDAQDVVSADDDGSEVSSAFCSDFNGIFEVEVEIFVHCDEQSLEFASFVFNLNNNVRVNKGIDFLYWENDTRYHISIGLVCGLINVLI